MTSESAEKQVGALFRLYGITAHFRDPRYNTGSLDTLPLRTLRCPPPATIHGLICAAAGRWVEPATLRLGWRMDYTAIGEDFQTCQMPERDKVTLRQTGVKQSPRVRQHLAFPRLTLLALAGVEREWFRAPAHPLSLGRSEDLVVRVESEAIATRPCDSGQIYRQCLPAFVGYGTLYPAPLYFEEGRRPVALSPKVDAESLQSVRSADLVEAEGEGDFYLWSYTNASGKE